MCEISCMLDYPHYGERYNKGAAPGYYESGRMWDLCDLITAELKAYGIKVGRTRTNKAKDMDLEERGRKAKGSVGDGLGICGLYNVHTGIAQGLRQRLRCTGIAAIGVAVKIAF